MTPFYLLPSTFYLSSLLPSTFYLLPSPDWGALALGFFALGIIGFGFFWVIRVEYHLGYLWWPYMLALGILLIASSVFVGDGGYAALLGIAGASVVWGAIELKEQAVRGEIGLFPFNPRPKPSPPLVKLIRKIKAPHL
jgi:Domain of unknown function (DUF4491)